MFANRVWTMSLCIDGTSDHRRNLMLQVTVVGVNHSAVLLFALFVHVLSLRLAGGIIQSRGV